MTFDCKKFDGVIFDLDGTLVDSSHVWDKVDYDFLSKRGFSVPKDYSEMIACLNFREGAEYTIERFGLDEKPEDIIAEWHNMAVHEYHNSVFLKDGARDFLHSLKERGLKLGLATASSEELYTAALKANGVYDYFDCFCSSEEVCRSKEYADVYIFAAGKLNCPIRRCAVFEDVRRCERAAAGAGFSAYLFGKDFSSFGEIEIL